MFCPTSIFTRSQLEQQPRSAPLTLPSTQTRHPLLLDDNMPRFRNVRSYKDDSAGVDDDSDDSNDFDEELDKWEKENVDGEFYIKRMK